jgi:hypothetical protein
MLKGLISKFNLTEPSTYASLAAVFGSLGFTVSNDQAQSLGLMLAGVFGLLGVFLKEKPNKEAKANG